MQPCRPTQPIKVGLNVSEVLLAVFAKRSLPERAHNTD